MLASLKAAAKSESKGDTEGTVPRSIKVKVRVHDKTFMISCGAGEQTIKWLALVVAQRYGMSQQTSGRARQREPQLSPAGRFMPCNVLGSMGVLYPSAKVKDVFAPKDDEGGGGGGGGGSARKDEPEVPTIKVELTQLVELEEDESLKQTTWAALAYNYSDQGRAKAQKKVEEDKKEEDLAKEARRVAEERAERERLEALAKMFAKVDSEDKVEEAMMFDWKYIRVESLTTDEDEMNKVKRIILNNFTALSDIFKHYSAAAEDGKALWTMTKAEFLHVMVLCRVVTTYKERDLVERVFKKVNESRGPAEASNPADELTRFEFLEALMLLSRVKGNVERDRPLGVARMFERFLQAHPLMLVARLSSGIVRQTIATDEFHRALMPLMPMLRAVFTFYADYNLNPEKDEPFKRGVLNLEEWVSCLKHAGIVDPIVIGGAPSSTYKKVDPFSEADAKTMFVDAQVEEGVGVGAEGYTELVFTEFVEATSRAGIERYVYEKETLDRMIRGLQAVANVANHLGRVADPVISAPSSARREASHSVADLA